MSRELRGYQPPTAVPITAAPGAGAELAYRKIDIGNENDRTFLRATVARGRFSSADSWKNVRRIGEVRYAIERSARVAGYTKYHAVHTDTAGNPTKVAESGVVAEIVNGITSRFGGLRALNSRYYKLMNVPGEAFMIRLTEDGIPDGYWLLSPQEIVDPDVDVSKAIKDPLGWRTARLATTNGDNTTFHRTIAPADFYGRLWMPDGEYTDECDTPFGEGLNYLCDLLWKLTESIKGRIESRFLMNGILLIPSQMNDAAISGEKPGDRMYSDNKVLNYLIHIMTTNKVRMDRAMDQMPIAMTGDADVLDKVRHMVAEFTIAETDLKWRGELLDKILGSLDQPKMASQDDEGSNHWTAWATAEQERRIGVQPHMDAFAHALTRAVLRRELLARGWTAGQILPWKLVADLSDASVKTNLAEDARQASDRNWVNDAFGRSAIGATDLDAPTPQESVRWFGRKFGDPYLAFYGLDGIEAIDYSKVGLLKKSQPGPTSDNPGDDPSVGPGVGSPGSPDSNDDDTKKGDKPA